MNEDHRRKQKDARKRRRKKQLRRRILTAILIAAVLIAVLFVLYRVSQTHVTDHGGMTRDPSGYEDGTDSSTVSGEPAASKESSAGADSAASVLHLTEEQIHTGDLILVNAEYGYDFDANAGSIDLVTIKDAQSFDYPVDKEEFQLASRVMKPLDTMIRDCDDAVGTENGVVSISSAYRSKEYQEQVLKNITEEYGEDYAASYVSAPGYSEHHTGLAVDLGITLSDGSAAGFSGSSQASWMAENCYRYGFIRRYPEDKADITGISNEAWHFRYVGLPHAKYMTENNLALEEYLSYLASSASADTPLTVTCDDGSNYSIWYTDNSELPVPDGSYTISGDNIAGYIITVGPV